MIAITPQGAGKQIVYFKRWVMRELGRSLINSIIVQQLSFVSPRQSRERNACSRGGHRMVTVMVQFVWLHILGTITHQGWGEGKGSMEQAGVEGKL